MKLFLRSFFFFFLVSWLLQPIQAPVLWTNTQPCKQGSGQEKQSTGSLSVRCLLSVEQLYNSRSVIIPGKVFSSHGRLLEQHGAFVGSVNRQENMPSRSDFWFFFKYVSNCFFTDWSLPFNDSHFYLVSFQHRPCPPSQISPTVPGHARWNPERWESILSAPCPDVLLTGAAFWELQKLQAQQSEGIKPRYKPTSKTLKWGSVCGLFFGQTQMNFHGKGDRFSSPVLLLCQESHSHSSLLRCKHAFQNKEREYLNTPKTNSLALSSVQYNCIFLRGCFYLFFFFLKLFPLHCSLKMYSTWGREQLWKISGWMVKAWPTCKVIGNVERKMFGNTG